MKTTFLVLAISAFFLASCSKTGDKGNTPPAQDSYLNTTAGSTWTYHEVNSSGTEPVTSDYTVTSSEKDSSINGKTYHIYNYSYGGNRYLNVTGHDYYQYDSLPGGLQQVFERLYLKDNIDAGGTWSQNLNINIEFPGLPLPVSLTVVVTNKIVEKGITRNVNGTNYSDVIHVNTSLSSSKIPTGLTSAIDSYYSPKYGLIENKSVVKLNYMGISQNVDSETKLTKADIK